MSQLSSFDKLYLPVRQLTNRKHTNKYTMTVSLCTLSHHRTYHSSDIPYADNRRSENHSSNTRHSDTWRHRIWCRPTYFLGMWCHACISICFSMQWVLSLLTAYYAFAQTRELPMAVLEQTRIVQGSWWEWLAYLVHYARFLCTRNHLWANKIPKCKRFGSRGIKYAGWVIEYKIFLHGLAQQWRPRKKLNLAQR